MNDTYNSDRYFREALMAATGFREYDARWVIEPTGDGTPVGLNYVGVRTLGLHLGRFLADRLDAGRRIVVGHDFRSYSENVKNALVVGLLQSQWTSWTSASPPLPAPTTRSSHGMSPAWPW
ncbi:hypothetical protein SVIOM342S_06298 [Streptomyces violaceorubidus]